MANIVTKSCDAESLSISNGRFGGHLLIHCKQIDGPEDDLIVYDHREGESGCKIILNGKEAGRCELIEWFAGTFNPKLEADLDYDRYGHITEVRFQD